MDFSRFLEIKILGNSKFPEIQKLPEKQSFQQTQIPTDSQDSVHTWKRNFLGSQNYIRASMEKLIEFEIKLSLLNISLSNSNTIHMILA